MVGNSTDRYEKQLFQKVTSRKISSSAGWQKTEVVCILSRIKGGYHRHGDLCLGEWHSSLVGKIVRVS